MDEEDIGQKYNEVTFKNGKKKERKEERKKGQTERVQAITWRLQTWEFRKEVKKIQTLLCFLGQKESE